MTAYAPRHAKSDTHELLVSLSGGPSPSCPRCTYEPQHARPASVASLPARPALRVVATNPTTERTT